MLAAAAFFVALASLVIGGRETNDIALGRQRDTISHALTQHCLALARELRVQTVWTEAFEKTQAHDQAWTHAFYGVFLSKLFGYDDIYVLSSDNAPVYGFVDGHDVAPAEYAQVSAKIEDLIAALRNPGNAPNYDVVATDVSFGNGQSVEHLAVADIRRILKSPATVVVSTIVPDRDDGRAGCTALSPGGGGELRRAPDQKAGGRVCLQQLAVDYRQDARRILEPQARRARR